MTLLNWRYLLHVGALASFTQVSAQETAAFAVAQQSPTSVAGQCELHVFPTENYLGFNSGLLSGFGALGALADQASHKNRVTSVTDMMKDYLGPDIQVEELRKLDLARTLKLEGHYLIIVEPPMPSDEAGKTDAAIKAKTKALVADIKSGKRLTQSTSRCYAELIIGHLFYHKAMMYGSNLFVHVMLRDYGNGRTTPVASVGSVKNPLEAFPPKAANQMGIAKDELRDAFSKGFIEWSEKKMNPAIAATR